MNASKDYMLNRYGAERYRTIVELNEIMNQARGRDIDKYYITKRVRAWITPIGTKCYAPHAVFENPILFIEQLLLKFHKECKGSILSWHIRRHVQTVPYHLDNITFSRRGEDAEKRDTTVTRIPALSN